jgi:hypothetical protein
MQFTHASALVNGIIKNLTMLNNRTPLFDGPEKKAKFVTYVNEFQRLRDEIESALIEQSESNVLEEAAQLSAEQPVGSNNPENNPKYDEDVPEGEIITRPKPYRRLTPENRGKQ